MQPCCSPITAISGIQYTAISNHLGIMQEKNNGEWQQSYAKVSGKKNTTLCTRGTFLVSPCEGNHSVYYNSSKTVLTVTGSGLVCSSIHHLKSTVKLILANYS